MVGLVLLLGVAVYFFWPRSAAAERNSSQPPGKSGKSKKDSKGTAGPPVTQVVATRARRGNIGVYFNGLGAVTPIYTVTVNTRVDGELMKVYYNEGDMVKKGDPLAEIDPRPYEATLTQFEGQLLKDQATLDNARIDQARYELLIKTNSVPEQQLATQQATVKQDEGTVKADQGQIQSAQLNVTYCHITAPITGRIGLRLVDPGNIVHASDTGGLLVITQIDPISVIFTIAEDQLPAVQAKLRAKQTLEVDAYDRDMKNKLAQGKVSTLDNQIDQTTGTVRVRATFDNKNASLFPNQFVNARLLVQEKVNVVLLTSAAIQRSSTSTFVYLVNTDNTVAIRNVVVGTTEGDDSEITNGLNPGDVVVLTGADKLQQGSKVNAQLPDAQPKGGKK